MDLLMPKRHKPLDKPQIAEQTLGHNDANNLEEEEEDRISDLPDSILCQILQKLPTKFAIGTAILSSRWKPLFYQIPNLSLVINDTLLFHPNSDPLTLNATFISFMYHLLSVTLRDVPKIRHFCLDSHQDYGNVHIDSWVSIVLKLKVQELALFFEKTNCGVSIRGIFSCTTLVHLLLSQHHVLNVPSSVCLPNLKSLFFDSIQFADGDSLERILAGCPVLEELSLECVEFDDIEVLHISLPLVKLLMMRNCHHESQFELVLDVPKLELLHYNDFVADGYTVKNMNSLLKAHIDVGLSDEQLEEGVPLYDSNVAEFVSACSNAELLYLSQVSMSGFLDHKGCYEIFERCMSAFVPVCLSLHLQKIKIEGFNGKKDELKLIEYFLKTARVLKRVKIRWACLYWEEKQVGIWKEVLMLPRCSKICQIELAKLRKKRKNEDEETKKKKKKMMMMNIHWKASSRCVAVAGGPRTHQKRTNGVPMSYPIEPNVPNPLLLYPVRLQSYRYAYPHSVSTRYSDDNIFGAPVLCRDL
ncbi:hypothetical protein HYC85_014767 [Camellia sinensis]|uniref:FBD domain-containing protein n=1 Tax=Camellia sinensis TaxID=4442 RepID=A0A7J7H7A8_CAMSI|nr:hypothetical protein HYC85_014767 [Camellia sinensis]